MIVLGVLSKSIVGVLLAPSYQRAWVVMPPVVLGGFLLGLQQRIQLPIRFAGATRKVMTATAIASAVNISLNLIFVPRFGYLAAAYTTLASYSLLYALMMRASRKHFSGQFPSRSLLRILLSGSIAGTVMILLHLTIHLSLMGYILVCGSIGTATYFILLLALRVISIPRISRIHGEPGPR